MIKVNEKLVRELIKGYQSQAKENKKIMKDWENTSKSGV